MTAKKVLINNYYKRWLQCQQIEFDFWKEWISTRGLEWNDDFERRMDRELKADTVLTSLIHETVQQPRILDVGSGPLSTFPKILADSRKVELFAIDSQANEYNKVLKENALTPPVKVEYGVAEDLTSKFPREKFDLVYMRNTLDHIYDPFTAIEQMLDIVKINSYVLLVHRKNMAAKESYRGITMWNISSDKNDFIIWNQSRTVNISNELNGFADVLIIDNDSWIDIAIKKRAQ